MTKEEWNEIWELSCEIANTSLSEDDYTSDNLTSDLLYKLSRLRMKYGEQPIFLSTKADYRDKIEGYNRGVYDGVIAKIDVEKRKIKKFKETNPNIAHYLPNKPEKIILSFRPKDAGKSGANPWFRPLSYYEFDLKRGTKKLLIKGKLQLGNVRFDRDGNPVFAQGFDQKTMQRIWYVRQPNQKDWIEIFRLHVSSFETFRIEGFDSVKPNNILVNAHNGLDKSSLWEFNYAKKKFGEVIYQRSDVDVTFVRRHSNYWEKPDTIVGVGYQNDKTHVEYFDKVEAATYSQLENAKRYIKELKKHNKEYKYAELDGADHFSNTLFYDHKLKLYTSIIDFLKNDCGPKGI